MRKTLFLLPHDIASLPIFGFGWVLALIVLGAIAVTLYHVLQKISVVDYWKSSWLIWCITSAVVIWIVPMIELRSTTGEPVGVAVRGYGVMLLLGVGSSVGLAVIRARRYGISEEIILAIAPWLIVGGIAGARLFYVIEYREQFLTGELGSTLGKIFNFTEGGLVVYGSFIGGFLAGVVSVLKYRLPFLRMGDIIVPCLFIGLGFGRIGCLMNGCCYGNPCEADWKALRFPNGSPVFQNQLESGQLVGITLNPSGDRVAAVVPNSVAARSGIAEGDDVAKLGLVRSVEEANPKLPAEDAPLGSLALVNGVEHYWPASQLPRVADPVQPTQIYGSIGGFLLCLSLCVLSRYVTREGWVMFIGFASYAVLRFVMEMLRNDEPGQFGTSFTIAQWVSIVVFALSIGSLLWLRFKGGELSAGRPLEQAGG